MGLVLLQTLLLQGVLPVSLLWWLGRRPGVSRCRWLWRCAVVFSLLGLLHLAGIWLVVPVSLSLACLALAVVLVLVRLPRVRALPWRSERPRFPAGAARTGLLAVSVGALGYAFSGTLPPQSVAMDLAFPLEDGDYYIANGGSNPLLNPHMKTLGEAPRFADWRGQSYGVDIIGVGPRGLSAKEVMPADPSLYRIFGAPVVAPCSGRVVTLENRLPDMRVPVMDKENLAGNHVILACGEFHVVLAHLLKGSVRVTPGQTVVRGETLLGLAGNSGNSSQPHLHVHVQTPGTEAAPLSGEPRFFTFDGWFPVRNDRVRVQ